MYWSQQVKRYVQRQLSFDYVVSHIWKPAFDSSCTFLQSLKDRSIGLKKVDELFSEYYQCDKIETEITVLEAGINCCISMTSDSKWIRPCVERMKEYRSLHDHVDTAKAFLKLKESLKLSGNFIKVQRLADRVSYKHCRFLCHVLVVDLSFLDMCIYM